VTSKTTHHVTALGRWMAADLYLREVDVLRFEVGGRAIRSDLTIW
jgi:phosphoenolpyruvate carboxylase